MPTAKSTKSPAFQFYPKDFLSSHAVDRMSMTERGVYITLLSRDWLDGGLPRDTAELASMVRMKPSQFDRMWTAGKLHGCFAEKNGRLFNPRLEQERRVQSDHRKKNQENALKRWNADATAVPPILSGNALLSSSSSASASASAKKDKKHSGESLDSSPTVIVFPVTGTPANPTWALTEARVAGWTSAYPTLNVLGECRKALVWVDANGPKTAKGMPAFLVRWLNTAVNRGGGLRLAATGTQGRGVTGAPARGKYDGIAITDEGVE